MRKLLFLLLIPILCGWYSPRTQSNQIASQDVLPSSSNTHYVGGSSAYWREGYFAYLRLGERIGGGGQISSVASFGYLYVSTDNSLHYVKDTGSDTTVVA